MTLDRTALLVWLDSHDRDASPLVGAIYEGLTQRIRRGDFDEEET